MQRFFLTALVGLLLALITPAQPQAAPHWTGDGGRGQTRLQYGVSFPALTVDFAIDRTVSEAWAWGLDLESSGSYYLDPASNLRVTPTLAYALSKTSPFQTRAFAGVSLTREIRGLISAYPTAGVATTLPVWGVFHTDLGIRFATTLEDLMLSPSIALRFEGNTFLFQIMTDYTLYKNFSGGIRGEVFSNLVPALALGIKL